MSVENTPPDLVMRAMGRLSKERVKPLEEKDFAQAKLTPVEPASVSELKEVSVDGIVKDFVANDQAAPDQAILDKKGALKEEKEKKIVEFSPSELAAHGIYAFSGENRRTIEEFRAIKREVIIAASQPSKRNHGRRSPTIMITSARPGDGKTHTTINLGVSLAAEKETRVLLVDADATRQSLINYLGIKADKGWTNYLSGECGSIDDILLHTSVPNLSILPAGIANEDLPELMSSQKMVQFIDELARRYDDGFVLFDCLPCMVSNEPATLSSLVDQALFVVGAHATSRSVVQSSLRMIRACPSVSLILNRAEPALTDQFGKYGYGYYGYGPKKPNSRSDNRSS